MYAAPDCPVCKRKVEGADAKPIAMTVEARDLCAPCLDRLTTIQAFATACNFDDIEATCFVDSLPLKGAGQILASLVLKMARSWGEDRTRSVLEGKLDQAMAVLRGMPSA